MEKAIDIKRRAQRCLQNGDLDGALSEYRKLTRAEEPEPINFVLTADLLFKKGDPDEAIQGYLEAVDAYAKAGLYKNAIAVCKKMARLALSPAIVLQRLAELHALDGLGTEAALYYQEYAEHQAHAQRFREAAASLRRAFECAPESVRMLEKASDWLKQAGDPAAAAELLVEAARHFTRRGQLEEAARVRARAEELAPGAEAAYEERESAAELTAEPAAEAEPEPGPKPVPEPVPEPKGDRVGGLESNGKFEAPPAVDAPTEDASADVTPPAPAGLRFDSAPATRAISATPEMADIEGLLRLAAERFKRGERELAGDSLVEAARAYEALERLESACTIYRSLGRSTHATPEVLGLWLRNCELRGDAQEAAEVACGLGDRALNEDDLGSAREWFERALRHVPGHEVAARRMQKLGPRPPVPVPASGNGKPGANAGAHDRVEVAVGRAQAVTLDLGSLIAEFQRGLETQLSGDPQSHYDLGMTYREMGLFDQAVDCFRAAAQDPAFRQRSAEMTGRCLLDQGRFDDAVEELTGALEGLGEGSESVACLRFQIGLAHEVAGRAPQALTEFERVYAIQPNFPDVAQKIRVLRRTLESV